MASSKPLRPSPLGNGGPAGEMAGGTVGATLPGWFTRKKPKPARDPIWVHDYPLPPSSPPPPPAAVDLNILQHMVESRSEYIMELTDKTKADVKGGTIIDYEGRMGCQTVNA